MSRIITLAIAVFLLFCFRTFAQYNLDYGGSIGASNYLGEIGGKDGTRKDFVNDIKMSQTRPAINAFVRYRIHSKVSVKGSLTALRIQGADSLSTNPQRTGRNLSFRNDIIELAATSEVITFHGPDIGNSRRYQLDFKSYIYFGVAGFYHNPKAQYNGDWYALRPLRTEGQEKPYSRIELAIPMGLGFYYTYKRKHRFGWEFGWRKTFTDYLDDISTSYARPEQMANDPMAPILANRNVELTQPHPINPANYTANNISASPRGNPLDKDNYFVSTFSYSYVIRGKNQFYRQQYSSFIFGNKRKKRTSRAKF
jgi:hypothetical protein